MCAMRRKVSGSWSRIQANLAGDVIDTQSPPCS
jgi:hypothetical protein